MSAQDDTRLRQFADCHGLQYELLCGDDPYRIENAGASFDGHVAAIRLTEHGRFGNSFYQILHAALLARQFGASTLSLFAFAGGPPPGRHLIDGLTIEVGVPPQPGTPTLVGHFFNSYSFQSALSGFPTDFLVGIVDRLMRPLFAHLATGAPVDADTAVLHFRGGDVFRAAAPHGWYVQPPASYHIRAALFLRAAYGVRQAVLLSEDDANPAVDIVARALAQAGMAVRRQSRSLAEDAALILDAAHLVSPFGTLCEALAMISTRLRSYTAFRQFESHRHLHPRRPSLPLSVLRAHGVMPIRIADRDMSYIPPLSWHRSDAELALLRHFPADRLHVDLPADDADDACLPAALGAGLPPATGEAFALRRRMIAAETAAAQSRRRMAEALRGAEQARQDADARIATAGRQVQAAQADLAGALGDTAAARLEAATLRAELLAAQATVQALRASSSWRVTAPLRRVSLALHPARGQHRG